MKLSGRFYLEYFDTPTCNNTKCVVALRGKSCTWYYHSKVLPKQEAKAVFLRFIGAQ